MFSELFNNFPWDETADRIHSATEADLQRSLTKERLEYGDLYPLFSPVAEGYLEDLAQRSARITKQRFGNTVQLYTPLYISNECTNSCLYCGFNRTNDIRRITLTPEQVAEEADIIYNMGFRHLLLLTGEHKKQVPVSMLGDIAKNMHGRFASVSVEVYPMETEEYRELVKSGIDGLTLYQETYNREVYADVHPAGMKRNFEYRLNGPDRGGEAGLRKIGIGALLGLSDWRVEGFYTALHALYLSSRYWRTHVMVSFPRIREASGGFAPRQIVSDRDLAHLISVCRIILPDAGLVLSTRESSALRDNLLPLGITMMSAGSSTEPGGYSGMDVADNQFSVEDCRSPEEIVSMIRSKGYEAVWKDWDRDFL